MSETKPPLGVKPSWIAVPQRITALAEAIIRYANDTSGEKIDEWAYEIALLSKVSEGMSKFRKDRNRPFF